MTAVIRLALPRLSASIMISCSISQLFTGAGQDCSTNASHPRTDSSKRTKISPLANSRAVCAVTWTSSSLATCSASSGCPRPENSIRFFRLSEQSWLTLLPSPFVIDMEAPSYVANGTEIWPGCQTTNSRCLFGFRRRWGRSGLCGPFLQGFLGGLGRRAARPLVLHPILDVALRARRHRQRPGRNILTQDGPGTGIGAVADCHRRHEHGV